MSVKFFLKRPVSVLLFVIFFIALIAFGKFAFVSEAGSKPESSALLTTVTATNVDSLVTDVDADGRADPGDTLEYTVTINNTGAENVTSMLFSDTLGNDLSLVGGSVGASPVAVNDGTFQVTGNVRIQVPDGASDLLNNDINPTTGTNSGLTASGSGTSAQGGNFSVSADGSFSYNPAPGYTGTDSFTYTVTNATGSTTATVNLNVSGMVWFINASAGAGGDGRLTSPFNCYTGVSCFSNLAADDPGDAIFLYTGSYTGGNTLLNNQILIGQGATQSIAAITGITFAPNSDAIPSTGATGVNIPTISTGLSAVNAVNLGSGNTLRGFNIGNVGTSGAGIVGSSFGTLTVGPATGGGFATDVAINTNGQAIGLNTGTLANTVGFTSVSSSGGASNVVLSSVNGTCKFGTGALSGGTSTSFSIVGGNCAVVYDGGISQTNNAATISVSGGHSAGVVSFGGAVTATNGTGLQFDNADSSYLFGGTVTLNGGNAGIDILNGSSGQFVLTTGTNAITNPSGTAVSIASSSANFSYGGTISKNSAGNVVSVSSETGTATIAFSGNIAASGTASGISLTGNSAGTTFVFQGGMNLATTTNTAFNATGGGTLSVCDKNPCGTGAAVVNVLTTTTGTALNVANTNISSNNLIFRNITSNGSGTANGINLDTTGASGGLTVTGNSGAGTGGTIANKTGADNNPAQGIGIYLNNVTNISLTQMQLNDFDNFAIRGNGVNNFTMRDSVVNGASGTSIAVGVEEAAMRFGTQDLSTGIKGTALFEGNTIGGGRGHNLAMHVVGSDTLNVTVKDNAVSGSQAIFNNNHTTDGGDDLRIQTRGTSNTTVMIDGVTFNGARGSLFGIKSQDAATQNITVQNNSFLNMHPSNLSGNDAVDITGGGNPGVNVTYRIHNNIMKGLVSAPIFCMFNGFAGTINGVITNNTVGTANGTFDTSQANRGSTFGIGFFGGIDSKSAGTGVMNYALRLEGNTFRDLGATAGILLRSATDDTQGTARFEATIKNNTLAEVGSVAGGIYAQGCGHGPLNADSGKMGLDIIGNTLNVSGPPPPPINSADGVVIDQSAIPCQFYFPGYAGPTNPTNQFATYLTGKGNSWTLPSGGGNPGSGGAYVNANIAGGNLVLAVPSLTEPAEEGFINTNNNPIKDLSFLNVSYQTPSEMLAGLKPLVKHSALPETISNELITASGEVSAEVTSFDKAEAGISSAGYLETASAFVGESFDKLSSAITSTVMAQKTSEDSLAPQSNELICIDADADIDAGTCSGPGFTLPAGKSVVIKFRAVIDTPPPYLTQVSNQGTVSGSNFASPLLTDDPDIAGAANPTVTLVDSTTITISSSQNPSITGQSVTFTATLTGAPVHATGDPSGTVEFFDGATSLGTAAVAPGAANDNTGAATITLSNFSAGTHTITADYITGGGGYNPNDTSNSVSQVVSNTAVWDGSQAGGLWNDGQNWTTNAVPALATNDVSIPAAGVTNNPVISDADKTVNNLTLSAGRTLTINNSRTLTVGGTLTLSGNNILGGSAGTVAIGSTGAVVRNSGYIETNLSKTYAAAGNFDFVVGTTNGYSPAQINITSGTFPLSFTVRANQGAQPSLGISTNNLNRYWTVTPSGGAPQATMTFNYLQTDVPGSETYKLVRVSGGTPYVYPNLPSIVIDTTANTATITGTTIFSDWTLANLAPTAASVNVGGRIVNANGVAVSNAQIQLVDTGGNVRTARTNPFGYYRFTGVAVGSNYTLNVKHKFYEFTPRMLFVEDDSDAVDFTANP